MTVQVHCKNCGKPLAAARGGRSGGQQFYCEAECRVRFYRNYTKAKYRNDPAFREAMKTKALQRYYRQKTG